MTDSNPAAAPPPGSYTPKWYERYKRWYWAHVLHRWPGSKRQRIVRYAKASLHRAGQMHYTESAARSELFHRKRGRFKGAHADCSQYSASLCHWVGVKAVTDTDWTGTLGQKGIRLAQPEAGCFVFFGEPPFVHMGVMIDHYRVIGFGTQSAPDLNRLSSLLAYFAGNDHSGHVFRDLTTHTG